MSYLIQTLRRVNKTLYLRKNMVKMNVEDVQGDDPYVVHYPDGVPAYTKGDYYE